MRIALTWDSKYNGLCFWNEKDGKGLNNLYEYYYRYNWWSDPNDYSIDANTTFDIVLLKEGNGYNFSGDESIEIILNGIKYRLNIDKTAEVLANDYSGDIIIPENVTYNDVTYRITSLENGCFNDCSYLTSISLPDGITSLGKNCFYSCDKLTSISLPEGLTSLGNECFRGCSNLTNISLPDGLTSLNLGCFESCCSLTSINLPASLTSLSAGCFNYCSSLTTIELPAGLTSLGDDCFVNCSSLTSMLCFAVEPPICYTNVVDKTTRLYVPKESIEKYEQKAAWNGAKGIYPLYPTDSISLPKEVSVILAKPTKIEYTIKLTVENRCLKVEGLADNDIIKISDYAGSTVYRGTEHNIYLNASGVYIVEVKGTTLKIHVK